MNAQWNKKTYSQATWLPPGVTLGPVSLTSEARPPTLKIPAQESSLWKAEKQNLVKMATLGREANEEVSDQFWASNMKLRFKPGARDLHCWLGCH